MYLERSYAESSQLTFEPTQMYGKLSTNIRLHTTLVSFPGHFSPAKNGLGTRLVPRTPNAEHYSYCKRVALRHAPDTRPIDPWALPPFPLSSLAEPRLLAIDAPRRPRGYFPIIAHALDPGKTVWFKRPYLCTSTRCA